MTNITPTQNIIALTETLTNLFPEFIIQDMSERRDDSRDVITLYPRLGEFALRTAITGLDPAVNQASRRLKFLQRARKAGFTCIDIGYRFNNFIFSVM